MTDFDAELWLHDGASAWCFVTLPVELSESIRAQTDRGQPGFGAVRVSVTVGSTTWATSLFPDSRRGAYVLPVKRDVRRREELDVGDLLHVNLEIV